MPSIIASPWDSEQLRLKVGQLPLDSTIPPCSTLDTYDMVLAKLSPHSSAIIHRAEENGFHFIGIELTLERSADQPIKPHTASIPYTVQLIRKSLPAIDIQGFHIADSRFMLDGRCAERLPKDFWDSMIRNHCSHYADVVLCAVSEEEKMLGFISCLKQEKNIDLFMVGVHPQHQHMGIGKGLMHEACLLAAHENLSLTTSCFANNVAAMNFYTSHQFNVTQSMVVMHRWKGGAAHDATA